MLSVEMIQMLITGGVTGMAVVAIPGFIYLKKKGVNIDNLFSESKVGLEEAGRVVAVAKEVMPNNPVVNVADIILKWVNEGANKSEQLYHDSQLTTKEERFNAAKETVYTALKEYNITPTSNQEKLIKDTIYAAVNKLGHADKTDAEKQAETDALKAQLAEVTVERDSLKNAITTAASSVQANTQNTTANTTDQSSASIAK